MHRLLIGSICLALFTIAAPSAQSDLDALMSRVLERRDENWKKLQQYTLNERATLQVTALSAVRLYGFERVYAWFPREGFFIRSPVKADGVTIDEGTRRAAEDRWLRRSQNRERRRADRARENGEENAGDATGPGQGQASDDDAAATGQDIIRQTFEPEFIESANFLRFRFDQGQYAFAGRERMLDRDVLRIEYYPTLLFRENRRNERRESTTAARTERSEEEKLREQMNKVSLVTLWVDPEVFQILRFEFRNIDLDFLPVPALVQIDGMQATMQMGEPFPDVWLPASVDMRFRASVAAGPIEGRYEIRYSDYRLPTVTTTIR